MLGDFGAVSYWSMLWSLSISPYMADMTYLLDARKVGGNGRHEPGWKRSHQMSRSEWSRVSNMPPCRWRLQRSMIQTSPIIFVFPCFSFIVATEAVSCRSKGRTIGVLLVVFKVVYCVFIILNLLVHSSSYSLAGLLWYPLLDPVYIHVVQLVETTDPSRSAVSHATVYFLESAVVQPSQVG